VTGWRRYHWRFADEITVEAVAWLERASEPFFLFMNYMDPHEPYRLHETLGSDNTPATDHVGTALPQRDRDSTPPNVLRAIRAYDSELSFVDSQIGRLFDELRRLHRYENSLIVVTSDHGEAFGEHGQRGHSRSLYDEEVRIPLLVRRPEQLAREVDSTPFSLASVPGLILNHLGLAQARGNALGRSVPPLSELRLSGEAREPSPDEYDHVLIAQHQPDGFKVIIDSGSPRADPTPKGTQLYDLKRDPFELHDLSTERAEKARFMSARLMEFFMAAGERQRSPDGQSEMSQDLLEELRALGYVR
jgi:arylsulfatase A-like enzyme